MNQPAITRKDPTIAAFLGFVFGCFGIIYVSWVQAAVGLVLFLTLSACTGGIAAPVVWFGFAVWGYIAANKHNENAQRAAAEHAAAHGVLYGQLPANAAPMGIAYGYVGQSQSTVPNPAPHLSGAPRMLALPSSTFVTSPCHACGASLRPGARFCGSCGTNQPQGGT